MYRAAKLDASLYEEVEADRNALGQAMGVVVISSVAAGVGALEQGGLALILFSIAAALLGWVLWAWVTYLVGTKILPEPQTEADFGQLLRTLGFSSAPGVIRVLGLIPGLTQAVFIVASAWMIAAMVVAVRQALDYKSTGRAIGVCVIGWVIQAVFLALLLAIFGKAAGS